MPDFTVTLSPKTITRLRTVLKRYNENTPANLTLKDLLLLHLQELAIADDLAKASELITQQAREDADAALQGTLRTTHDEMITALQ